jgi:putative chitobiose transport system substrate-binding protein
MYEFAKFVRENSDYYAFSQNWGEASGTGIVGSLPYSFIQDEEIPVWNEDGTEVIFNIPEAVAKLQMMVDMINDDLIPRESMTEDHREMIDRFSEGEVAILLMAPHMLRLVEENNPDVYASLGIVPGVTGSRGANGVDVQSLVIPTATEDPNAALALAVFVTNPEVQTAFSKEVDIYPSNLLSYEDPFFQSVDEANLVSQIRPLAHDYVLNAENQTLSFPNSAEVEQVVREETEAALLGVKSAEEAIATMQDRINEIVAAAAE